MTKEKKVLVWFGSIDDFINKTGHTGGINVQMYFWAKTFSQKDWTVYTFSERGFTGVLESIHFISNKVNKLFLKLHLGIVQEIVSIFRGVIAKRPDVIIVRGACRVLHPLSIICKLYKIKLVFFGASDVNFVPGRDGSGVSVRLYRKALKRTPYIVAQNEFQQKMAEKNYGKKPIILFNLWNAIDVEKSAKYVYDAIWVSNLSPVKQAELYLELAKKLPEYKFAIVGGVRNQAYYNRIEVEARSIENLEFLGYRNFDDISRLISSSKLLICTSEHEGFPNTFLQAWAMNVPVISTVNPSDVITKYNLGYYVGNVEDMEKKVRYLIENDEYRYKVSDNISSYFVANHSCDGAFEKLIGYLYGQ